MLRSARVDVGEQAGLYKRSQSGRYRAQTSLNNAGKTVVTPKNADADIGRRLFHGAVSIDEEDAFANPTHSSKTSKGVDLAGPLNHCLRREDLLSFYQEFNPVFNSRVDEVLRQDDITAQEWLNACSEKYGSTPKITAMTVKEIKEQKHLINPQKKASLFSQRLDQCFQKGQGSFNGAKKELHVAAVRWRSHTPNVAKGEQVSPRVNSIQRETDKPAEVGDLLVGWGNSVAPTQECLGKVVFNCLQAFDPSCLQADTTHPHLQEPGPLPTEEDFQNLQTALQDYYRQDFVNTIIMWKRANPRNEDNYERFLYDKFPENIKTAEKPHLDAIVDDEEEVDSGEKSHHGFPSFHLKDLTLRRKKNKNSKETEKEKEKETTSGLNLDEDEEDEEAEMRRIVEESRLRCEQEFQTTIENFLAVDPSGDFLSFLEVEWPKDFAIYQRSQKGDSGMRRDYTEWQRQFGDMQARVAMSRAHNPGWNPTHTPKARGVIARRETFSDKEVTWIDKRVVNDEWKDVFMEVHSSDALLDLGAPPGLGD